MQLLQKILGQAVKDHATDVMIKTNAVARYRIQGALRDIPSCPVITEADLHEWVKKVTPERLLARLNEVGDVDFALQQDKRARFRVNLYRQRQSYSMVIRIISTIIPNLDDLNLPPQVGELALLKRGLVLVTGSTGSGKSTTLAAMLQRINIQKQAHIVTIEDPIEYDFQDINCTISQREVGLDISSFSDAIRSAVRQNPDVILVGELRDKETIQTAMMAAETGHLVFSTLHTSDSVETLSRILSYFTAEQHPTIRSMLGSVLKAIVSQRLIPTRSGKGLVPAAEILTASANVRELITRGDNLKHLYDAINEGSVYGMQSFDSALFDLYSRKLISYKEALRQSTRPSDLDLKIKGIQQSA